MQPAVEVIEPKTHYTVDEFIRICGLSRTVLYRLWKSGKGPRRTCRGVGLGRILISITDAEAWFEEKAGQT